MSEGEKNYKRMHVRYKVYLIYTHMLVSIRVCIFLIQARYTLNQTIIYTNPFKDVVREMKEKRRKKEEGEKVKGNTERFIDDEVFVENKNDSIGKYINWKDLKKNSKSPNSDDMNKSKLNVMKKETFSKTKKSNMDFSCW